ncbi:uncharacterized protein DEA37_0009411 [Paragonimus westermani]|uniref:Uncharacterized protein n=1 Tax=Paragonimus westermani TaxID=34504 RepID=A0A5J4NKH0_9TREM|nr:uncharacterized protein DEA37_0009411 [Paragonimus westermani]
MNLFDTSAGLWGNGEPAIDDLLASRHTTRPSGITDTLHREHSPLFLEGLGCCFNVRVVLRILSNARPVFRRKLSVPCTTLHRINLKIDRLQKTVVANLVRHSAWAAPNVLLDKSSGIVRFFLTFLSSSSLLCTCISILYLTLAIYPRSLPQYQRPLLGVKTVPTVLHQTMDMMPNDVSEIAAELGYILMTPTNETGLTERLHTADYVSVSFTGSAALSCTRLSELALSLTTVAVVPIRVTPKLLSIAFAF